MMEFTRLNMSKESDSSDRGWHMVISPRSAEKSLDQQDLLGGEFCKSLPRAHFLRPGCFPAVAERGGFSPDRHDLCFKGNLLQDQCSWDSKSSASVAHSCSPNPLAQPGFYSPKIPRSRHCDPTTDFSLTKNTKEYHAYTLPLPHAKIAVFKQSALHCRPQGIKTSVVEKPRIMRAAISPTLAHFTPINPIHQQTNYHKFQYVKDQEIQTKCFSSLHQCTLNSTSTEISKKQEHLWNDCEQAQSTTKQNLLSVKKRAQDKHVSNNIFTRPQNSPSPDHLNLQRDTKLTGYCKLSVFNGTCYSSYTLQDGSNSPSSSQSHGISIQNNSKQRNRQESNEDGNHLISNSNNRQMDKKNVFGQPRVIATLRSGCTPRPVRRTTVVEDLKKLILMDEVPDLSTQTCCATERPQDSSSTKPLVFCSPVLTRHRVPSPNNLFLQSDPSLCQPQCGLSDTLVWDKDDQFKQNPLNLSNTACKLDWNSLVNAAEDYEMQERSNLLVGESSDIQAGTIPELHSQHLHHELSKASDDNAFIDFPDQLSHLEAVLMRLSTDLLKEKKDKVALLAEVLKLRMSNQHLKEESLSANAQLHKICQMFNINPEYVE